MKNVIGSLVAVAGLAAAANAQSVLNLQVSTDGVSWSDNAAVRLATGATGTVLVRATISWTGAGAPLGFASLTWQPVAKNARPGVDSFQAFADQGNNTNGGAVNLDGTPLDGPFGRVMPFGATGPSGTQRYAVTSHTGGSGGAPNDIGGNAYLRISRNDVTRWVGTGPTSGTAAVNNFNGAGGVACVQKANPGAADPPRNNEISNVVIFQVAMTVGGVGNGQSHEIQLMAPQEGMSRNSTTGNRESSWFRDSADQSGAIKGAVEVDPATITITPAPGALALLGLGGLVAGRRRR